MSTTTCGFCGSDYDAGLVSCPSCGGNVQIPDSPLPSGTNLDGGKFTIVRVLGRGGFGITYEGYDETLHRAVAIKELFPEGAVRRGGLVAVPSTRQSAFQEERTQVVDEARRVASLKSSNIVEIYSTVQENDTVYIVMEFLSGHSLEHEIHQSGSLKVDDVQAIALTLCDALQVVHGQHMLHRDIKPANVMLTDDGRTVLIDFGAAREFVLHRTSQHTRLLTADYAAPEQYATEARFGPYTDIFSLGATLFHALSGSPPENAIERSLNNETTLVLPDECQGPLGMAIQSSLHLRVDDRPQNIAAFRTLLRPEVHATKKRWPISRRWMFTAVAGITILLVISIGWYSISQRQGNLNLSPSVSFNPTSVTMAVPTATETPVQAVEDVEEPAELTPVPPTPTSTPVAGYVFLATTAQVYLWPDVAAETLDPPREADSGVILVRRVADGEQIWLQMEDTFFILAETVVNPEVVDQLPLIDKADIPNIPAEYFQTPTPAPQSSVNSGANLRGGPGISYPIVGGLPAGSPVEVKSRTEAGDWLQLASGAWIAAFLIDDAPPRLPIATNIPALLAPTFTPIPATHLPQPTPILQTPALTATLPCETDEVKAYVNDITEIIESADFAMEGIGSMFALRPLEYYMRNDQWLEETVLYITILSMLEDNLNKLHVPTHLNAVHNIMLSSTRSYRQASDALIRGIKVKDGSHLLDSVDFMGTGTSLLQDAHKTLVAICE